MKRSTRAYARIVLFACAGDFLAGQLAAVTGLPGLPARMLGGFLGLGASGVPWREVLWLRLQVAALRAFGGCGYLAWDFGGRKQDVEARMERLATVAEQMIVASLRDELAALRPPVIVIGGKAHRTVEDLRDLPNPPLGPSFGSPEELEFRL